MQTKIQTGRIIRILQTIHSVVMDNLVQTGSFERRPRKTRIRERLLHMATARVGIAGFIPFIFHIKNANEETCQ